MGEAKENLYTIAIMVGDTPSDFTEEVVRGFYTCAQEEGVNIVLLMGPQMPAYCSDIVTSSITGNYRYQFNSIYYYTHFIKPDAIIFSYGMHSVFNSDQDKLCFYEQFSDIPRLVLEDTSFEKSIPCYTTDNYNGMRECVEHLVIHHGYRKVAFLSGPKNNYDSGERLRAYHDVMKENGLEVTDTMVVYGDYSDFVDDQVNCLLDKNPGLEAIVCANDNMARSCYRVCTAHNLIIGKDIAITGYDDITSALSMNPPLTTVSQRGFQIGYTALKAAVAMCRGEQQVTTKLPTKLMKRCSCGCTPVNILSQSYIPKDEVKDFIEKATDEVATYVFSSISYPKDYQYLTEAMSEFFEYIYNAFFNSVQENFNMDYLLDILKRMAEYPHISNDVLLKEIKDVLQILLANANDVYSQSLIASLISSAQQIIHSLNIEKLEKEIYLSNRKAWSVPAFARDLASESYLRRPQDIFYRIMDELQKMGVRSAYLYLFVDEPLTYDPSEPINFPEYMNLVAYFNSNDLKFYYKVEQPKFTTKDGLMSSLNEKNPTCLASVLLFSEQKQYGLLMCEIDQSDIDFLQICSMQLGTMLHFMELNLLQREARKELQNSMEVIEEQNKVLSFISDYDELTKLLNRRGFMERALASYRDNVGKRAFLIFGDLDHLKQINDIYGHKEGDFAIKNVSERFRTILPEEAICGRIGGDEFVAFLLTDEEDFQSRIEKEYAEAGRKFNEKCDKPYYVEMSLGIYECICNADIEFDEMIKKSDELLYAAKAIRRKSVKKETYNE